MHSTGECCEKSAIVKLTIYLQQNMQHSWVLHADSFYIFIYVLLLYLYTNICP